LKVANAQRCERYQSVSISPPPDVGGRQVEPGLVPEIFPSLLDATDFEIHLNSAREVLVNAARAVAESHTLGADVDRTVEQSRASAIRHRAGEVCSQRPQSPGSRKLRSLCVQAEHECQRFLRVATDLTSVIERSAEIVTDSARFLHGTDETL